MGYLTARQAIEESIQHNTRKVIIDHPTAADIAYLESRCSDSNAADGFWSFAGYLGGEMWVVQADCREGKTSITELRDAPVPPHVCVENVDDTNHCRVCGERALRGPIPGIQGRGDLTRVLVRSHEVPSHRTPDDAHAQLMLARLGAHVDSTDTYLVALRGKLYEWVAQIDAELAARDERKEKRNREV